MDEATISNLERALFTTSTPGEDSHRCVVAISGTHAITYRHGTVHSLFEEGQLVDLHNVIDENNKIEVYVVAICEDKDVIIFEVIGNARFTHFPRASALMYRGQQYMQFGLSQGKYRRPALKEGLISQMCDGYFVGTSHAELGDSGASIFDMSGRFIGMTIGKQDFRFCRIKISDRATNITCGEIADHFSNAKIVDWHSIKNGLSKHYKSIVS